MLAAVITAVAAVALWSDWCRRTVPHWVVATLLALWLVACVFAPGSPALDAGGSIVASALCGAGALLAGFALHAFGWLGAGDGKLLAVMALWLGPGDLPLAFFGTVAIGLVLLAVAWARPDGEFRTRGIPFAWAIVPPSATVLLARAAAV